MNVKKPTSDEAWAELLSAYLDGELEGGERRTVEHWLAGEPRRARQLQELRRVSGLLQAWTVEAPEPSAAFLRRLEELRTDEERNQISKFKIQNSKFNWRAIFSRPVRLPWPVAAALFFFGVLAGGGGIQLYQNWGPEGGTGRAGTGAPGTHALAAEWPRGGQAAGGADDSPISDTQAAALWHKVRTADPAEAAAGKGGGLLDREALLKKYRQQPARASQREDERPAPEPGGIRQMIEKYRKAGDNPAFHWAVNGK